MGATNITDKVKTTHRAVPQIYAYTTPEIARHNGWTKIGYTEKDVEERVREQTHTADVQYIIHWHGNALYMDGSGTFKDHEFHSYLQKLGIKRDPNTVDSDKRYRCEWFEVEPTPAKGYYFDFCENKGVLDTPTPDDYVLRAEQERAVQKTIDYSLLHERGEFLWNAKPRFGKTLTSYDLCKRLGAQKILIVTNRPAIANSWYDDYVKFFGRDSGLNFISSVDSLCDKPYCMTRQGWVDRNKSKTPRGFIEFVSLQDIKGSKYLSPDGEFDKLKHVADIEWDVLIIDEAHEAVDTFKTAVAFDRINRKFTLHLSGTPFKAIARDKFEEDAIFHWTYADEQNAKHNWPQSYEVPNPYEELPQLNMFTYKMSDIVAGEVSKGIEIDGESVDYAFDLNEFFATNQGGHFIHSNEVNKFLDALTKQTKFPFSTPELRDELRHTFWLLNYVDSAKALAKRLKAHPVFSEYEIIVAAGDGKTDDDEVINTDAFNRVCKAIANHDKTITISVGQLTTGVTIPEWTGVLMLSNMKSPAQYMQAAFRAQNPCLFNRGGKFLRKENAYVFDFDPARTLTIYESFANDLYTNTASGAGTLDVRKQNVHTLLNFFPVIGEDDNGEMVELDAERVLSIPRKIKSQEVVRHGFMNDFLFQNIGTVFRAPQEVINIIEKFEPLKGQGKELGIKPDTTAQELCLDEQGNNVEVTDEIVIGTASELFGDKKFGISENINTIIDGITVEDTVVDNSDKVAKYVIKEFTHSITEPIVETAKQYYSDDMKTAQKKKVERSIAADIGIKVNKEYSNFKINQNVIERDREKALENAQTQEEADAINAQAKKKIEDAHKELIDNLKAASTELLEDAQQTAVREVETAKRENEKKETETVVKDHLRGFSRTIPSFLMAYGDENTKLENFDKIIPEDVFYEVTSITAKEFRFLRDGGDFENSETGKTEHFDGNIFDEVVFDDSVKEFIRLRSQLANYFDESLENDIFDYVPPQKTNQIFTPRKVVVQMVDLFEQENPGCFDNPQHTFADLYMKSGLYITEIIKRLYNSKKMRELFPDDRARLDHILENQVFGIAPTEIIYQIARHFILGFNDEIGQGCKTNFVMADSAALAKEGKLAEFVDEKFGDKLEECC